MRPVYDGIPTVAEALAEEHDVVLVRGIGLRADGQKWGAEQMIATSAIRGAAVPIIDLAVRDITHQVDAPDIKFEWQWFDFPEPEVES